MILDKTLRRIRQILALIIEERMANTRNERLQLSWQTRSLAMIMVAAGNNDSKELMDFATNLTIDNEEYAQFNKERPVAIKSTLPVNSVTQDEATAQNFNSAAEVNNLDMLALFGQGLEKGKPGHD